MIGDGDEGVVLLAPALVHQEVVVAAAAVAGIVPTREGARFIDRTASFRCVEELANSSIVRIGLALHNKFVAVVFARVPTLRLFKTETKMTTQPLHVTLVQRYDWVGTAIARTLQAIVLRHRVVRCSTVERMTALMADKNSLPRP